MADLAMQHFMRAADVSRAGRRRGWPGTGGARRTGARAQVVGAEHRVLDLLRAASEQLEATDGPLNLRSLISPRCPADCGTDRNPFPVPTLPGRTKSRANAASSGDASAMATAKLAVHDAMWTPGTAGTRLPVIAEMLESATASGDDDLVAEAHLLRAAALLELG